ncbi:MAG: hypothetical protein JSW55_18255 [Chloroflexota bacterium]|nr:MAG: hypothetical protein JSW55_18255 [Chloroflexota bacterium]
MSEIDTNETPEPEQIEDGAESLEELEADLAAEQGIETGRRRKLILLIILLILLCGATGLAYRYLTAPAPLPELVVPDSDIHYAPHYLFSIYDVDKPVGVTVSERGDRIFVTESGGERLVKIFDNNGELLDSFAPPGTMPGERSPVYLAIDSFGRLFVTDRLQHAIYVYDSSGNYLDTLVGPELALSEYVKLHAGDVPAGANFFFNVFQDRVTYRDSPSGDQTLPAPNVEGWSPLGVRIGADDRVYITDVTKGDNKVMEFVIPKNTNIGAWHAVNPDIPQYGDSGSGNGEFLFPNAAAADSQGRVFVSDGNNGRITVWDEDGDFLFNFGAGGGEAGLSLPRGVFVDERDRLFVVDAVGQNVKVFDVSAQEPEFLYSFGDWGLEDGMFNYPNDIYVDDTGRVYVVDRENHRLQVWSY